MHCYRVLSAIQPEGRISQHIWDMMTVPSCNKTI